MSDPSVANGATPSPFRAAVRFALASMIGLAASLFISKVIALRFGPGGVGTFAIVASIGAVLSIVVDFNIGQEFVRTTTGEQDHQVRGQRIRTVRSLTWVGAITTVILAAVAPTQWYSSFLAVNRTGMLCAAVGGAFAMLATQEGNVLSVVGQTRIRPIANSIGAVFGAALGAMLIMAKWRTPVVWVYPIGAAASYATLRFIARGTGHRSGSAHVDKRKFAQRLVKFGGPMTASALVGGGALLILPVLVRTQLGLEAAGFYRAGMSISAGYLGLILSGLGAEYFPRLSALRDRKDIIEAVDRQLKLVAAIVGPLAALVATWADRLVIALFSDKFVESTPIVQGLAIADVFKSLSWCLAFALLAKASPAQIFKRELLGGVALVALTGIASDKGVAYLGWGVALAYALYFFFCLWTVRQVIGYSPTKEAMRSFTFALGAPTLCLLARHLAPGSTGLVVSNMVCALSIFLLVYFARSGTGMPLSRRLTIEGAS